MKNYVPKFKTLTFLSVIFIFTFLFFNFSNAQLSPRFIVSWKAQNYAPVWYGGKVLPVVGTLVDINFELIDAGKIANLSQNTIRWYVNYDLVKNESDGLGIKLLRTTVPNRGGDEMSVRIVIIDYANNVLNKIITIPVVRPEAVIDSPYLNNNIRSGLSVFRAIPLFFNVSGVNKMAVNWSANDVKSSGAGGNPWQLDLNLTNPQSGTKINIGVSVKNVLNYLELASQSIILETK